MRSRSIRSAVAVVLLLGGLVALCAGPAAAAPTARADYVIIAGAAGLRWDDVNPIDTPTLWQLAEHGSVGALSVSSARTPTCPADGWLTLGAGNYAQRTPGQVDKECPATPVQVRTPDAIGANLPDQETDVAAMNRALPYGTQPGALAEAVRCTAAVGQGGAIAAARPYGRVDRYAATLPADPKPLLSACVLSIVDLGTIDGDTQPVRRAAARHADNMLAGVLAARPANSLVIVAGLADTNLTSRLHVAIADGPGYASGWLTSPSTSRQGYVQLTDLAPTVLTVLDRPIPVKLFAGQPAESIPGRPADLTTAVSRLSDADREAGAQRRVTGSFFTLLTLGQLLLYAAMIPFLRRARRAAGPAGPALGPHAGRGGAPSVGPLAPHAGRGRAPSVRPLRPHARLGRAPSVRPLRPHAGRGRAPSVRPPMPLRVVHALEVLLVAAAFTLPAALVADVVPWWRVGAAGQLFGAVTLTVVAVLTAAVRLGPWWRGNLGPLGAVGGIVGGIVGLDVLTGARLQLNGVAGYSALEGGRYAGVGTVGLGLLFTGFLLVAGWYAQRLHRRRRPWAIAAVGGAGVVLVGSPYLGADAGGAVALTAGVCVAMADLYRRLPHLRPAGLGHHHRPRGHHGLRPAGPHPVRLGPGQPRPLPDPGAERHGRYGDPPGRCREHGRRTQQPADRTGGRRRGTGGVRPAAPVGRAQAAVRHLPGGTGRPGRYRRGRAAGRVPRRGRVRGGRCGGRDRGTGRLPGCPAGARARRRPYGRGPAGTGRRRRGGRRQRGGRDQ